jgi:putative ABC transport system permease protein
VVFQGVTVELSPIVSAMLRNKTGAILVALQIAIALAVVTNSMFIVVQRVEKMHRSTGIDSENILFVRSDGFGDNYDQRETVRRDLSMLRALPGIIAASATSRVPLSGGTSSRGYQVSSGDSTPSVDASFYDIDEQGIAAFGATLIAGRGFREDEVQYAVSRAAALITSVIVTRDLAKALFGNEPALGKTIYADSEQPAVVVGIVDNVLGGRADSEEITNVIFHPQIDSGPVASYVIRTTPGDSLGMIGDIQSKLEELNASRTITYVRPHSYFYERTYQADRRMVALLVMLVSLMIAVTALGIAGLASFQVRVRTKQIGTRRAVGARRIDILRYFMLENLVLTSVGLLLGTILAFGSAQWLSAAFSLPRLNPWYVVYGIVSLAALGQLAVLVPARHATLISPAIATRTV